MTDEEMIEHVMQSSDEQRTVDLYRRLLGCIEVWEDNTATVIAALATLVFSIELASGDAGRFMVPALSAMVGHMRQVQADRQEMH